MRVNHLEPTVSQIATWTPPAQTSASRDNAPGPLDLHKLLRLLRWHMRMIATLVAVMVVGAGVVLAILPPKYKAVTVVLVDPRQPRVTASEAVLSGIGADAAAVESQVELIQSSALARRVIASLRSTGSGFATRSLMIRCARRVEPVRRRRRRRSGRLNRLVYRFQTGLSVQRRGLTYILRSAIRRPIRRRRSAFRRRCRGLSRGSAHAAQQRHGGRLRLARWAHR